MSKSFCDVVPHFLVADRSDNQNKKAEMYTKRQFLSPFLSIFSHSGFFDKTNQEDSLVVHEWTSFDDDPQHNRRPYHTTHPTMQSEVLHLLEAVGKSLPDRERHKGAKPTTIKLLLTADIKVTGIVDTFVDKTTVTGEEELSHKKNTLAEKNVVLLFGRQSHYVTRSFLVPKMALVYSNLTRHNRSNVEFLYVSMDETQVQYDTFTKIHRKFIAQHTPP